MRGAAAVHHAGTSSCESILILPASKIRQWKLHCHLLPAGGREWLNVDFRGEGFEKLAMVGGQARTCTRWTGWVAKTACRSLFQLVEIMNLTSYNHTRAISRVGIAIGLLVTPRHCSLECRTSLPWPASEGYLVQHSA